MNYVCISPHFPLNYVNFPVRLRARGARVLGIGSEPYDNLSPALREALTEYYRVDDMEDYDGMLRACGFFTHKYGKIDRIESHNEHWLVQDARLRTDFNVFGFKNDDMGPIKHKSAMKEVFSKAGIPVARGRIVRSLPEARALIKETGWPVCAKPDSGVGAARTYKIRSDGELVAFFDSKPDVDYIMEEFIEGEIHTFDGLTDRDGEPVFINSFVFPTGVMESVNDRLDMVYYSQVPIPADLADYGLRAARAFGLKERFFHFEFFRTPEGRLVALEINARPPGGWSMDLFNYGSDIDLYDEYARLVTEGSAGGPFDAAYYTAYVGRKQGDGIAHVHSVEEVLDRFAGMIVHYGPIDSIFAAAIGDYAFALRAREQAPLKEAAAYILQRAH